MSPAWHLLSCYLLMSFFKFSAFSAVASADVSFAYVSPPPPLPRVTHLSDVGLPSSLQLLCFLLTSSLCAASLKPKNSPVLVAGVFFLGSTCGLH